MLILTLQGCATSGADQRQTGESLWEVRVWNGDLCFSRISNSECIKILRPKLKERANLVCDNEPKISGCFLSNAVTGRRLKCMVSCK